MDIEINELQVILLPGKCPPKQYLEQYLKAYHCWREVWEDAYRKEFAHKNDQDIYLSSDDFTRQDEVVALFYKGQCAAVCFLKWVEANEDPVRCDSYFKIWPEIAFKKLCSRGQQVLVCSQFTVHFNFRKGENNIISWKDLLTSLVLERFRHSDRAALTGTMRLNKNMGEAMYRGGAVPLVRNIPYGDLKDTNENEVFVDLLAFYQDTVTDSPVPGIHEIVKAIFPKTIALVNPILSIKSEVKNVA